MSDDIEHSISEVRIGQAKAVGQGAAMSRQAGGSTD